MLFEIAEGEKRLDRLRTELIHLDAVLRMFRPDFAAEGLPVRHRRPTKSPYFVHGELSRRIYAALRERETVSGAEVADIALAEKGIGDRSIRATFVARFLVRLDQMALRGDVERIGSGNGVRWRLRGGG